MSLTSFNCVDCNQRFSYHVSGTILSFCSPCSLLHLDKKDAELKSLQSELEKVQSRLQFLLPQKQLDNESADGILKGDVRIVVKDSRDEDLFAHKFVLASRSPVFRKMFDAKMREEVTGMVVIDDASHDVVKAVIKFCYDAEIEFTDGVTAEEVLQVAHKYDIALLQNICEENLIGTISCENLPNMLKIAMKFKLTGLELAASQFFKDHFDTVIGNVLAAAF